MAQLYGQVCTHWNQCFVIDCSLSPLAGHKPFTCSHSILRNTWLNIHAVCWMRFSARLSVHAFTTSRNLTWSLFVSSAVSELSFAWTINCFLRYVCCCIVVKDKSLSVLMVDRCANLALQIFKDFSCRVATTANVFLAKMKEAFKFSDKDSR